MSQPTDALFHALDPVRRRYEQGVKTRGPGRENAYTFAVHVTFYGASAAKPLLFSATLPMNQ